MAKIDFSFEKDTTSRLIDVDFLHNAAFTFSTVVLLLTSVSLSSHSKSKDAFPLKNDFVYPSVEWKFNSSKRIVLATESARLMRRLDNVIALCADDDDIMPIGKPAIMNMKCVLKDVKDHLLKGWNIFPNNNGTLALECKENGVAAIISIGYNMISYSVTYGEQIHIIGKEPFSFDAVNCLLAKKYNV